MNINKSHHVVSCSFSRQGTVLEPAEICDLLKGSILLICVCFMQYVDVSMMYHIIRGQAIIKLYIFFNMLEVSQILGWFITLSLVIKIYSLL